MAKKGKSVPIRGIIAYVAVIAVTGFLLNAAGLFDNPILAMEEVLSPEHGTVSKDGSSENSMDDHTVGEAEEPEVRTPIDNNNPVDEDKSGGQIQNNSASSEDRIEPLSPDDPTLSHEESDSMNWSLLGDVFFNIWLIGFVSAVIIVMQPLLSFTIRRLKKASQPVVATSRAR